MFVLIPRHWRDVFHDKYHKKQLADLDQICMNIEQDGAKN